MVLGALKHEISSNFNGEVAAAEPAAEEVDRVAQLTASAVTWHHAVKSALGDALGYAMNAGDALLALREFVPAGQWQAYLQTHTDIGERSARVYIQVAKKRAELTGRASAGLPSIAAALEYLKDPTVSKRRSSTKSAKSAAGKDRKQPAKKTEKRSRKAANPPVSDAVLRLREQAAERICALMGKPNGGAGGDNGGHGHGGAEQAAAQSNVDVNHRRTKLTLREAWRKRMIACWELASRDEQERLVAYLREQRHDNDRDHDHGDAGGDNGPGEVEWPQAQVDELRDKLRQREIKITGLESAIEELKAALAKAQQTALAEAQQSGDLVTAWGNATDAELSAGMADIGLEAVLRIMPHWRVELVRRITDWPQGRPAGRNPLTAALRTALSHLTAAAIPHADVEAEERAALNAMRGIARLNPNYHTLMITVHKGRHQRRAA